MELEAVLRGTKVVELINVPHRARGLLQEFLVNGPGRPAPEQEWPPPQQGMLSRVVRVRFESPALARMGLRRLEEAMLGVVQEDEWSLRPISRSRQDNWRTGRRSGGLTLKSSRPQRWTPSRCYCLAGRHSSPQQGGGVEATARGQIGDCMKASTSVTGTRAGTAAQALKMWRHRPRWAREEPT